MMAALLLIQPSVRSAQADEPGPVEFVVGGVAGATVRAEPNGTSNVVATVLAGGLVSQAGQDVTTSGVVWKQVRTADGVVGYLPAGFLVALQNDTVAYQGSGAANGSANVSQPGQAASVGQTGSTGQTSSVSQAASTGQMSSVGQGASTSQPTSAV